MKAILILLLTTVINQSSFSVDYAGDLIWEHIYQTDMTSSELHKSLHLSSCFTNIEKIDDTFYLAKIPGCKVDYEKYGFKRMKLPLWVCNTDIGQSVAIIQYKEGRYKVTIKNINLSTKTTLGYGKMRDNALTNRRTISISAKEYLDKIYSPIFESLCELEKFSDNW